jgi:hypothetical protein
VAMPPEDRKRLFELLTQYGDKIARTRQLATITRMENEVAPPPDLATGVGPQLAALRAQRDNAAEAARLYAAGVDDLNEVIRNLREELPERLIFLCAAQPTSAAND